MIRILIVDDHEVVRFGLQTRLQIEPDLQIVGEAWDGSEAIEQARLLKPNVILMDVELPGIINGITATAALAVELPQISTIILTHYDDTPTRQRAVQAGAAAFVIKHQINTLLETIREVATRTTI